GNMSVPRAHGTGTLLPDGKGLIVGGSRWDFPGGMEASAELYDTATGLFANTGSMAAGRSDHTATLLNTGKVLIAGGGGGFRIDAPAVATAELYTPATLIPAPILFSVSGDGRGQGAIWNAATGQIVSPENPAGAGEILSLYTVNLAPAGLIPSRIAIGGRLAEILFFGDAPGFPGYFQVNFRVPAGLTSASVVSVRLTYLGRSSNEVTIGVR
ncbi:MAG TPA: hypothetical protein VLZ50_14030, partial [Terracidiphilus sp.]|nr:hypothetical protein [Terracidiphilus sp.]